MTDGGSASTTGLVRSVENRFASFEEARAFVQGLKASACSGVAGVCKVGRPTVRANIPSNPNLYYDEWDGWLDWLGKTPNTAPPSSPEPQVGVIV